MTTTIKYVLLFLALLMAYLGLMWKGTTTLEFDRNFQKITSPLGNSLVLGTSRAARLKGGLIQKRLSNKISSVDSMLNYAFNLSVSPYGAAYNQSIRRLCEDVPSDGQRTFIIAIDPWALAQRKDDAGFPEAETYIAFNRNHPMKGLGYLYAYNDKPLLSFFSDLNKHKGEHLKTMSKSDTASIRKHTASKIKFYRTEHFDVDTLSTARIEYLAELVRYCDSLGDVFLVRIPVSEEMRTLEEHFAPNFMETINQNEVLSNTPQLDFYPYSDEYDCFDGNHLFEEDAKELSEQIGATINWYKDHPKVPHRELVQWSRAQ